MTKYNTNPNIQDEKDDTLNIVSKDVKKAEPFEE